MKALTSTVLLLCVSCVTALWPIPTTYSSGEEVLWIDRNVHISYNGASQVRGHVSTLTFYASAISAHDNHFLELSMDGQDRSQCA